MQHDIRYNTVKILLNEGRIKSFKSIFIYIPFSVVARDLHTTSSRMKRLIAKPELLMFKEINTLADLIGWPSEALGLFLINEVEQKMEKNKYS